MNPPTAEWHPALIVSTLRLAVVAVAAVGAQVHSGQHFAAGAFHGWCLVAGLYAAISLGLVLFRGASTTGPAWVATDLIMLSGLTWTSGGAHSDLRMAFVLIPTASAVLAPRRLSAIALVAALLCFSAVALSHVELADGEADYAWAQIAAVAVCCGLALLLALVLSRRAGEAERQARISQRLVGQLTADEETARRNLAAELHDTHVQNLYAALHELRRGPRDDRDDLALVDGLLEGTLAQLRDRVADLYPAALELAGMAPALDELAARKAAQSGIAIEVTHAAAVPTNLHRIAFSVVQELLANAIKHADASHITITISRVQGSVLLTVSDNGSGLPAHFSSFPVTAGHIGLRTIADRTWAMGGHFRLESTERGQGTTALVGLPLHSGADSADHSAKVAPHRPGQPRPRQPGGA